MTTHPTITPVAQNRRANWLAWLSACVAVGTLVLAGIILPTVLDSKAGLEAQQRSDDLTGCRAEYRARIDLANVDVIVARSEVEGLVSDRLDVFADIIAAALADDQASAVASGDRLTTLQALASKARTNLDNATERLQIVTDVYDNAVKVARTDPDQFLADCRKLN